MRERIIKFRAWLKDEDIPEGYMVDGVDNMFVSTRSGELCIENYEGKINRYKKEQYILMQYTGLKDKNGREIYESDRLEHPDGSYGYVVWNNEQATFLLGNGIVRQEPIKWTEYEIVGNLYENQER